MALINQTSAITAYVRFKWGLCLPDSCEAADLAQLIEMLVSSGSSLPFVGNLLKVARVIDTSCQLNSLQLTGVAIAGICFASVFACLVVVGTAYDTLFLHSSGRITSAVVAFFKRATVSPFSVTEDQEAENSTGAVLVSVTSVNSNEVAAEKQSTSVSNASVSNIQSQTTSSGELLVEQKVEKSFVGKCVSVFSVRLNGTAIFNTNSSGEQLDCLHGIRFLSMVWIITGHIYGWGVTTASNLLLTYEHYVNSWTFQLFWNGTFSVDTFFVVSGLLTTFVTLRYVSRARSVSKFQWHLFYIHRYLRLTPVYGIMIFLYVALYRYMSYGPQWNQNSDKACEVYWWTNLLYINNFYNATAQCFGHAWYLANDMQFFIMSPLVIIPLFVAPVVGISVIFLLITISVLSTAIISAANDFSANVMDQMAVTQQMGSLGPVNEMYDIYNKPYCRVGAYAIGMLVGYILFRTNRKIRLNYWLVLLGWTMSTALALTVLFCLYDPIRGASVWTTAQNVAYLCLARIAWSFSIGWVLLACTTGYGGWVNGFLSWKAFAPLSRLTYCAYLIHPYVIPVLFMYLETPTDMRELPVFFYAAGNVSLSYAVALVFSLVFEAPFLGLEKLLFGRE